MNRWTLFARLALAAGLLAGCGGGSGLGGIGSGGTGSTSTAAVAVGPISGFGSIIVNGVHYDDTTASIADEDGASRTRDALRLGMQVEVAGSIDSTGLAGTADSVRVVSELRGVADAAGATSLTVLGATVRLLSTTVIDGATSVAAGDFVEVYGTWDPSSGSMTASRVEIRTAAAGYKRRGTVSSLDAQHKRFSLGGYLVDYSALATVPAGLANGAEVRIESNAAPVAGQWVASALRIVSAPTIASAERVEVEGYVRAYTSLASFQVDGIEVDGSAATISGGTAADIGVGRRLELKGSVQAGKVVASSISLEDDSSSSGGGTEFEVKGVITAFASSADFLVRSTRIDASGSGVSYENGTAANLADGRCVEVHGMLESGASGSVVRASSIHFENDCH